MSKPSLVVFAAGKGTRMLPLTEEVPKAMLPILDVPLIDLALARGAPIDWARRFVNLSGPLADLRRHLEKHHPDIAIFDEGPEPIGQAATLRALLPDLTDTVVTYNCDLVSDLDLTTLLERHAEGFGQATLAVQPVGSGADFVRDQGGIRLIDRRRQDARGFTFLGAGCFDRSLLSGIREDQPLGLTEGLLRPAIEQDEVRLVEHAGYARDSGTPERYRTTCLDALDPRQLPIDTPGTISPAGWYLGPHAVAGGTLGKGAVLLGGACLQPGTEIKDCVVWPGSTVPAGTKVSGGIWFRDRLLED